MAGLWSVALRGALDAFSTLGLDVDRIAREAGVPRALLDDPDARVPLDRTALIWPAALSQWDRPGLGLAAGRALGFGKLEALDYALATADTVGEGLARLSIYWDVVTGGATGMRLVRRRGAPRAELLGYRLPDLRDYALAASAVRMEAVGVPLERVSIAGPARAPRATYERVLGAPIELDAAATTFDLPAGALERRVPPRHPGLRPIVERELERQIAEATRERDPVAEIRREVTTTLGPGGPTLEVVAARLELSPRQLQRRLHAAGTSFTRVVEDARRALADVYLARGSLGVAEISYLLGYSEPSAFSRAFKRWHGHAPEHRRRSVAPRAT